MKRIRLPVALLIIWLFAFYNVDRLSFSGFQNPLDLSPLAYLLVPVAAVALLLVPQVQRISVWLMAAAFGAVYLGLNFLAYDFSDAPRVLVEISAILGTIFLARWVSTGVLEFEQAVVNITLGQIGERRTRQGEMYREVRRARAHQRPLTLVAIKPDDKSITVAIDRMVQEAQEAMIRQYVLSNISKTLADELDDYNIIAKSKDHFLVLLPEVTTERLPDLEKRLRRVMVEKVGVAVQIGSATLSRELTTFEGLVQKATEDFEVATDETLARLPKPVNLALEQAIVKEGANGRHDH